MCWNTSPRQAETHKLRVDKAAAALEARLNEKGVASKKPVVGKEGKKAAGVTKQKKPLVWKKAISIEKTAVEKKPVA